MKALDRPDHQALAEKLRHRVLDGPGKTDVALRRAAAARAAGGPPMAAPYDDLARQIGEAASRIVDEQVANVVVATGGEAAAFELIMAAALGAGLRRWQQGLKVLKEAMNEAP